MDGWVKVTLLKPYAFGQGGKNIPIAMRYGYTEPRVQMRQDEYGRDKSISIPGKPIKYVLDWDGERSVIMPEAAARMYFGHWDLPETIDDETQLEIAAGVTHSFERDRVANNWGGYTTAKLDSDNKKNYVLPYIDVPKVPHVRITAVNEAQDESGLSFEPWERYRWNEFVTPLDVLPPSMQLPPGYINPNSAKSAQQYAPPAPGLITVSEADMGRMIADAVAKALEAATAPKSKSA